MGGSEHNQAEGMVLSLIDQGVPDTQIRAIFGVGDSMIAGLKAVTNSGIDTLHTRRSPARPSHTYSDDDLHFLINNCNEWELEEGFPCSHHR
ncbi:hypothetical protein JG688_00016641 [Phytophthora aleatoria]|uniref:Uncharacterized protein n=1 Tax=Phytophthora aleatoria TaxID=2496075 RepID=A0A8J5IBZ5_9STRA|nr:hypothetical protein JG688_00016641 [Phytophthora aleatoria]